jgi:hypothetical protein
MVVRTKVVYSLSIALAVCISLWVVIYYRFRTPENPAIKAARKAIETREHWKNGASYSAVRDGENWIVTARRIDSVDLLGNRKYVTGGERIVTVSKGWKVIRYVSGL